MFVKVRSSLCVEYVQCDTTSPRMVRTLWFCSSDMRLGNMLGYNIFNDVPSNVAQTHANMIWHAQYFLSALLPYDIAMVALPSSVLPELTKTKATR